MAHLGADRFDRLANAVDLVGAQVIHEDDIALRSVSARICST